MWLIIYVYYVAIIIYVYYVTKIIYVYYVCFEKLEETAVRYVVKGFFKVNRDYTHWHFCVFHICHRLAYLGYRLKDGMSVYPTMMTCV
jgi:hypothetical protein